MSEFNFSGLARANPLALTCHATIREKTEYFQVDEQLPFSPSGDGGHAMLLVRKTGCNTDWIAKQIQQFAGVDEVDIGYAGLKDRHAVTTQWFTVKVEGRTEPNWDLFECDGCEIISVTRHNKKLRRGVLSGNTFRLTLTNLQGDKGSWTQNLERIAADGVPNYFAEQRFGHNMGNLARASQWFFERKKPKKRPQRSLILSAARSWLFNLVVSERVKQGSWQKWLPGDAMQLNGTGSVFVPETDDEAIEQRLAEYDIHPTGPLWGRGRPMTEGEALKLEQTVLADWEGWQQGLEQAGLKQERRALRVKPQEFNWTFEGQALELSFFLPSGSYATAVMRELAVISDVSQIVRNLDSEAVSQF